MAYVVKYGPLAINVVLQLRMFQSINQSINGHTEELDLKLAPLTILTFQPTHANQGKREISEQW